MTSSDTAIIFFSGHGSYVYDRNGDESDGYDEVLIPYDCNPNDISTVIVDDEFNQWIDKLPTKKVLAIVDSCYSGTVTKNLSLKMSPKFFRGGKLGAPRSKRVNTKGAVIEGKTNETLLAASQDAQTALEKDGRGLFTVAFCQAVKNGAANILDAFHEARKKVLRASINQQEPMITGPRDLPRKIRLR